MRFILAPSPLSATICALSTGLGLASRASHLVTYQGFANTVSCTGTHFQCTDGGAVCCSFPTGFGYSVKFNNLPPGSQGQGYTGGGCATFLFAVFGPGTKCWNGGGTSATHMNWFHSPPRGQRDQSNPELNRALEGIRATNCSSPTAFTYDDPNGEQRTIRVPPDEGAAHVIASLYLAGDLTPLSKYESC